MLSQFVRVPLGEWRSPRLIGWAPSLNLTGAASAARVQREDALRART